MINMKNIALALMVSFAGGVLNSSAQTQTIMSLLDDSDNKLTIPIEGIVKSTDEDQRVDMILDNRAEYTLGSSTVVISGDELRRNHHPNLLSALMGRVPGMIMSINNSLPGSESYAMNTRGYAASPIVLIDGVEGDVTSLNIADVEQVTFIKDAATVLYGMHAPAGVLNIITKRGGKGDPMVNVSANYTMQEPLIVPNRLGSADHVALTTQAYENDIYNTNTNPYNELEIAGFTQGGNPLMFPDNDWYSMFMQEKVHTMDFAVSASGGSEKVNYYTSVGYLTQSSPFIQDNTAAEPFGTNQFTLRSNVDFKIGEVISGYANISGRINRNMLTPHKDGSQGIVSSIYTMKPTDYGPVTPYESAENPGGNVVTYSTADPIYGRLNRSGYNQQLDINFTTNIGLEVDLAMITKGLKAYGSLSYVGDYLSSLLGTTNYERYLLNDASYPTALLFDRYNSALYENTMMDYSKTTGSYFKREILGGISYENKFNDIHSVRVNAFAKNDYVNDSDMDAYYPLRRVTFAGQFTYGYKDIAFVDYMASYQGSEEFAANNRFGFFNSASLSLVLSNMDFLKDNDVISYLKLRGSYGMVGSDNFGLDYRFAYQEDLASTGGTALDYVGAGYELAKMGNPNLKWEENAMSNFGIDVTLLSKLTLSADIYRNHTTDILIEDNLTPPYFGVDTDALALINAGETDTKGIELQLGYSEEIAKDFTLGVSGFMTYFRKEIIYDGEMERLGYAYPHFTTGMRAGQCWGREIDYSYGDGSGYFTSLEDIAASGLSYVGNTPRPGDFVYVDQNNDYIIDDKDLVPMGETSTPQINWGAEIFAQYKGLDFSVLLQGTGKHTAFNSGIGYYENQNGGIFFEQHLTAWTPERYAAGEEITGPALTMAGSSSQKANDYWLQNKAFTRIKNIELGYSFNTDKLRKLNFSQLRVYVSVTNLLTFDHNEWDLHDVQGGKINVYGTPRYSNIGLNMTF